MVVSCFSVVENKAQVILSWLIEKYLFSESVTMKNHIYFNSNQSVFAER